MTTSTLSCTVCGTANPSQAAFCMACGGPLEASAPGPGNLTGLLLQDQLLKQRYRILAQIGRGGFAAVYKAEDLHFGSRLVAVKEMSQSGLSQKELAEAIEAFEREAHLLARLQYPNLPRIYDYFSERGRWYFVMDFIEYSINSHYGTDGRPMIPKTPSVTGRHERPVRQQGAQLFSSGVSFFKHGWSR